jgi:hypothetical protein
VGEEPYSPAERVRVRSDNVHHRNRRGPSRHVRTHFGIGHLQDHTAAAGEKLPAKPPPPSPPTAMVKGNRVSGTATVPVAIVITPVVTLWLLCENGGSGNVRLATGSLT